QEVLLAREDRTSPSPKLEVLNTVRGSLEHLKGSIDPLAAQGISNGSLSPDGTWVLTESHDVGAQTQHVSAVPIDGSGRAVQFRTFENRGSASQPFWFPRENRWVTIFNCRPGFEAVIGNVNDPKHQAVRLRGLEGREHNPLDLSLLGWRNGG